MPMLGRAELLRHDQPEPLSLGHGRRSYTTAGDTTAGAARVGRPHMADKLSSFRVYRRPSRYDYLLRTKEGRSVRQTFTTKKWSQVWHM